ncbi:TPA: hypothetical protein MIY09_25110 [Klebsiella pneumoniae]|nr:hypothetical protein C4Y63_019925 [Klebsiella pneumoniae subsp. pneumoniae]HBY5562300.1 hypothetical protein [Klebsiella pneumoniae]
MIYLYALFNCGRSPIKNWRFFNAGILNIYDKMELFIKKGYLNVSDIFLSHSLSRMPDPAQ